MADKPIDPELKAKLRARDTEYHRRYRARLREKRAKEDPLERLKKNKTKYASPVPKDPVKEFLNAQKILIQTIGSTSNTTLTSSLSSSKNNKFKNIQKGLSKKDIFKRKQRETEAQQLEQENALLDQLLAETNNSKIINTDPIDATHFYRGSKNIPTADAQYQFTADMVAELKRCSENILYFAENYFYIVDLNKGGKTKIQLYEAQKRVLNILCNNRFTILLSSRQAGKSTLMTIYALWLACFSGDQTIVIVANKESTAINIFKRIRMAYEQLPNFLKPGVKDYAKTAMTLANDSAIMVSTTTATTIRGLSISCLILEELAFIPREIIDDFWSSVIPTISSGQKTKIFVVSTPNGTNNLFYKLYSSAEKGENGWAPARIDWWEVPGRDEAWKRDMILALGSEEKFNEEFGNTFVDNSITAINVNLIERFKKEKKPPIWVSEDKEYRIFEKPDPSKIYIIGVDVSEGIGRAYSVAQVLDITDLNDIRQVATYSTNTTEPNHFAAKLVCLAECWGVPPILIERNNCGAQVIDAIHHTFAYEKIVSFAKTNDDNRYRTTRALGVYCHTNIRFTAIQGLRYWINHLQVVSINDPTTISEFETFVRDPNGQFRKKSEGFYDDHVFALIWALFILHPEIVTQWFEVLEFNNLNQPSRIKHSPFFDVPSSNFFRIQELDVAQAKNSSLNDWYNDAGLLIQNNSSLISNEEFELAEYQVDRNLISNSLIII